MISEICGMTPEARMLLWKILLYRPSETTPSWMRAPAAVVDPDQRPTGLHGQLLDLDDLLAVDLAEAAAEHGGVLAEDADLAAVDGAVAGHHAVAERTLLGQAEVGAAVLGQRVELDE